MNDSGDLRAKIPRSYRRAGQGAIFLCAVLWSTGGLFIKLVDWHPLLIAGARSFFALGLLIPLRLLGPKSKKQKPCSADMRYIVFGGLAYAVTMILFVIANKLTTSANAVLLQYSAPVWAAILGWFIAREKPAWTHWWKPENLLDVF
jgi:drug/metabolite transporter (DMT)-like permease